MNRDREFAAPAAAPASTYVEKPVTFTNQGEQIVGIYHLPDSLPAGAAAATPPVGAEPTPATSGPAVAPVRLPAVLLLHGFTGHKLESHRMFVKMARRLAQEGIVALRFDFRGSGDSAGDFADMTVSSELSDAEAALAWLQARPEVDPARVGVLGFSLGGAVASLLASRHAGELRAVALWSAVADLSLMARHAQADRRLPDGRVDLGGNVVGPAFLTDLPLHDLQAAAHRYPGPVLMVHGTADQSVPPEHARRYQAAFPGPKMLHWVDGADHTYNSFAWEHEVLQVTADWLRERLA